MWEFSDLRAYLLPLAKNVLSDIDKIVFAREFGIEEWLVPAHMNLCQRTEALTMEEATKIGIFSLLMISRLREQFRPANGKTESYCDNCGTTTSSTTTTWDPFYGGNVRTKSQKRSGQNATANTVMENKLKAWIKEGCITD